MKSNLKAIKASLAQSLADETAYQETYGPRPSYGLDGENYDWPGWRTAVLSQIETLNKLIQQEDAPFSIRSRVRT